MLKDGFWKKKNVRGKRSPHSAWPGKARAGCSGQSSCRPTFSTEAVEPPAAKAKAEPRPVPEPATPPAGNTAQDQNSSSHESSSSTPAQPAPSQPSRLSAVNAATCATDPEGPLQLSPPTAEPAAEAAGSTAPEAQPSGETAPAAEAAGGPAEAGRPAEAGSTVHARRLSAYHAWVEPRSPHPLGEVRCQPRLTEAADDEPEPTSPSRAGGPSGRTGGSPPKGSRRTCLVVSQLEASNARTQTLELQTEPVAGG